LAFDPAQISYEALIQRLVDDPRVHAPWSDAAPLPLQYRTAVWAQSEAQLEVARRVLGDGGKETIPVLPSSEWFDAEEYHQNFLSEFKDLPDEDDEDNPWGTTNGPGTSMGL
jgi:peptide methionine sulfoxide reductase MsrA